MLSMTNMKHCHPFLIYLCFLCASLLHSLYLIYTKKHDDPSNLLLKVLLTNLISNVLICTLLLWLCSMNYKYTAWIAVCVTALYVFFHVNMTILL